MKRLSRWARLHPIKARTAIVLLHILLIVLAVFTGIALLTLGIMLPVFLLYATALLFITIVFFYPSKKEKSTRYTRQYFYPLQKTFDFIIGACSFLMITAIANKFYNEGIQGNAYAASTSITGKRPTAEEILASLSYRDKKTLTGTERRILKSTFRQQLKLYVKAKLQHDNDTATKVLLVILAIIAAVGLLYLLAALACTVACNGSAAGAILIALLGVAGVTWLLIFTIRKITHHKKKEEELPAVKQTD